MSRILSGVQEPKLGKAYEIAMALGVSLDYLMDETMEVDPIHQQLVPLSEDELTILKIVRRLGMDVSIDRLLGVASSSRSEDQAGTE